jgi:prepilin-type N-terminal cleavage/methylation domain-containing protein
MTPLMGSGAGSTRGYTAIEVLMAMTVMAISGVAVMTMQKTSVTANLDARRTDVANEIARTWVERLQRDSMQWTLPSPQNPAGDNLASAPILAQGIGAAGAWILPTQEMAQSHGAQTMSPAFDLLGRDLPLDSFGSADFCVNVRLRWLAPAPTTSGGDLIRADVRVIWPIGIFNSFNATAGGFCNAQTAADTDPNTDSAIVRASGGDPGSPALHAIYLTTTIRKNASP